MNPGSNAVDNIYLGTVDETHELTGELIRGPDWLDYVDLLIKAIGAVALVIIAAT